LIPALEPREPAWGYDDLFLLMCLAVPSLLLGFVSWQVVLWLGRIHTSKVLEALPAQFIAYFLWFACVAVLLRVRYDAPFWRSLNWNMPATSALPALLNGLLLAIMIAMIGVLLRTPAIDSPMQEIMKDRTARWFVAVAAVTIGPVSEELIFRGFLMPLLTRSLGVVGGILLAALPFALLHGPQYAWSWRHVLLILMAGCAFGWVRFKTGSTAIAAVTHAAYNATFLSVYLVNEG
jgi:membrane protease YdiL (CAAX protease family)